MRIMGVNFESVVDGDGVRVVLYVSGCTHNCPGCHNMESHDFRQGRPFTRDLEYRIIDYIKRTPYIAGVTISGGDPMMSARDVCEFVKTLKLEVPERDVWLYTGYTVEELINGGDGQKKALLGLVDVLVDGKFEQDKKSFNLPYRGSSNQRIIDVPKTLGCGRAVERA